MEESGEAPLDRGGGEVHETIRLCGHLLCHVTDDVDRDVRAGRDGFKHGGDVPDEGARIFQCLGGGVSRNRGERCDVPEWFWWGHQAKDDTAAICVRPDQFDPSGSEHKDFRWPVALLKEEPVFADTTFLC